MGTYGFEILVGKTVFTDQEQLSNLAFCPPEEVLRSTALLAILFKEWTYDDKLLGQLHKLKKDIKKPPVSHPSLSEAKLNLTNPAWNLLKEINSRYVFSSLHLLPADWFTIWNLLTAEPIF